MLLAPLANCTMDGTVKQVLIESGIEEDAIFANGSADGAAELLLAIVRLIGGIRLPGVEVAVAQIVEAAAMPVVRA